VSNKNLKLLVLAVPGRAASGTGAAAGPGPGRRDGPRRPGLPGSAHPRLQAALPPPDRRHEAPRHGPIGWIRQWIESVNDTLNGQLDLEYHGGRTTEGLYAQTTQRFLASTATIWHNWHASTPSLIAYDH
jgi:hypothetical protein